MSKYTVSVAEMLSAYVGNLNVYENEETVEIRDPLSNQSLTFDVADFNYFKLSNPNFVIKNFGSMWIKSKLTYLPNNFTTDNPELNDKLLNWVLENFIRKFYMYEISRENALSWFVALESFFNQHLPYVIMSIQKIFLENLAFTTREAESTGNANANATSTSNSKDDNTQASADIPQNDVSWQFDSADPAKTYCFNYSTVVNGAKGENNTTAQTKSDQNTKATSKGRDYTIMQLINQLQAWSNGVFVELWQRAKAEGLFMLVF